MAKSNVHKSVYLKGSVRLTEISKALLPMMLYSICLLHNSTGYAAQSCFNLFEKKFFYRYMRASEAIQDYKDAATAFKDQLDAYPPLLEGSAPNRITERRLQIIELQENMLRYVSQEMPAVLDAIARKSALVTDAISDPATLRERDLEEARELLTTLNIFYRTSRKFEIANELTLTRAQIKKTDEGIPIPSHEIDATLIGNLVRQYEATSKPIVDAILITHTALTSVQIYLMANGFDKVPSNIKLFRRPQAHQTVQALEEFMNEAVSVSN